MNKTSVIYNFIDAEEILRKSQEKVTDCCKEKTCFFECWKTYWGR